MLGAGEMANLIKIKKWLCLNDHCEYETGDLDTFIEHLKENHDIYIDYEVEEETTK